MISGTGIIIHDMAQMQMKADEELALADARIEQRDDLLWTIKRVLQLHIELDRVARHPDNSTVDKLVQGGRLRPESVETFLTIITAIERTVANAE